MSIAHTAGEYMLSDALLPDPKGSRAKGLRLELSCDRVVKFITVGLPLVLVSLAFAREFSTDDHRAYGLLNLGAALCVFSAVLAYSPVLTNFPPSGVASMQFQGSQISCFSPANFTGKQAAHVDAVCWESLLHYDADAAGDPGSKSLWVFKVFPYSLLVIAVAMYLPYLLWRYAAAPSLNCDLFFIIDELDKSYNRSIRLVQHMVKLQQSGTDPEELWEEYDKARKERYFEFPLLERYLSSKQRSYYLVSIYVLRNLLLLFLIAVTCLYLGYFHVGVFFQDEFSCLIKSGLLQDEPHIPDAIPCKLVFFSVFQLASVCLGCVYVLLGPVIVYHLLQLCQWDKRLLSIYEMLPAFDLLSRKMLTCPLNDLNIILLFLRANIAEVKSFSRLSVLCTLRDVTGDKENIDTVVDFMTLLAGLEMSKPKQLFCTDGSPPHPNSECIEMKSACDKRENSNGVPSLSLSARPSSD